MRNGYKKICPVIIHFTFYISLFPSGIRVAEPDTEMIMGTKAGKKFCFVNHITNPSSNTSSIIKDQQWRDTSNEFKDIKQPLADTFSRFATEYLTVSIVAVRKRYSEIFLSGQLSAFIEICFSKVNLGRTGIPYQFKVCFFCLDGTAFFQIPLNNAVAAGVSILFNQAFIYALCSVMLFPPVFFVLSNPLLDNRFKRIQFGGLCLNDRRYRREVLLGEIFADRFRISTSFLLNFTNSVSTITQIFDMIDLRHSVHLPFLL